MVRGPRSKLAEARIWTLEHAANLEGNTYYDSEGSYHPSYTQSITPFEAPPPGRVPEPTTHALMVRWTEANPMSQWLAKNPGKTMWDYLDITNSILYPKNGSSQVDLRQLPPRMMGMQVSGWMPLSSGRKGEGLPQRSLYKGVR